MKNPLWLPIAIFATVISSVQSFGELEAPSLKWGGFASLREGQIVKGEREMTIAENANYDHVWVQEMIIGLSLESKFKNFPAVGNISAEISVNNDNVPHSRDYGTSRRLNFYPYLSRADLLWTLADGDNISATLDIGYFPYKYNSSVRNLGEYLFRSGTYPQYLYTEIDFPMARLMGLKFSGNLHKIFNFDILLTTNIEWTAIGDLNLSGIFSFKPFDLFEFGLGGSWCSIISADIDKTTPLDEGTQYLVFDPSTGDSMICNYTFAGQKAMARLTLDIKQLFPGADIFGKEDLKLYSEAAILGLINYPVSRDGFTRYDNIMERIPVMVGFNFPAFKFLDVLSAEVEWFNNPYPNSTNTIRFDNQPVPLSSYTEMKNSANMNVHDDDWKWSIYAKKTVFNNLSIMCQVARDHIRWYRLAYTKADGTEALRKNDEWYYTFKFGYAF